MALPDGLRAVIVDDDGIACEHTRLVLKALGIEADYFTDGKTAANNIRAAYGSGKAYDLLLTDYRMPEMNGLELTRLVHEFDNGETAVIMLTGYNWDIDEDEAETDGVDGILAKPLFSDILLREIYKIISKKKGHEEKKPETAASAPAEIVLAGRRVLMA